MVDQFDSKATEEVKKCLEDFLSLGEVERLRLLREFE